MNLDFKFRCPQSARPRVPVSTGLRHPAWGLVILILALRTDIAWGQQSAGNAGLPLQLQLSTATSVIKGPDVFDQIPVERGVLRISGPGILRVTWAVKKDFDEWAARGGYKLSWYGQGQATWPGRLVGSNTEPADVKRGQLQKFVWLVEIPADVQNLQVDTALSAYWYPVMDQNPWAGITIFPSQQGLLIDWLESTSLTNVSGRYSGSTSTGFGVDLILQEQNGQITGTLNGNPITGQRRTDGTIAWVSVTPKQQYRGNYDPQTGKIKGTFDCEDSKTTNVGWEVARTTYDNHPILTGGPVNLPTKPTHIPPGGLIIQAGTRKINEGENGLVPIEVLGGQSLANLNVTIEYDPQIVRVNSGSEAGAILTGRLFAANAGEVGLMRFGFAGQVGLTEDGVLTRLPITAVGKPGTKTPLKVTVTAANDVAGAALNAAVISGEIEIVAVGGDGSGDVNGDGKVDTLDALMALRMSVKLLPENLAADLDENGVITSNDARLIMLKFLGR